MTQKKRKAWKISLFIALGLILVFFIASSILISYWKPIVSDMIKKNIQQSTKGLYTVDFEDIDVFVLLGNASVSNLRLTPNTSVYKELTNQKLQPDYLFAFQIDRFKLKGLSLYDIYKNKEVNISEIEFKNPKIQVFNEHRDVNPENDGKSFKNPYDLIKGYLKSVTVNDIIFTNVDFQFTSDSLGQRKSKKVALNYIDIKNLHIDSLAGTNLSRPFYTEDIKISIKDFELAMRDSLNTLRFEELILSTAKSSIEVYNLKIIPKFSEKNFKDLADIERRVGNIKVSMLDAKELYDLKGHVGDVRARLKHLYS